MKIRIAAFLCWTAVLALGPLAACASSSPRPEGAPLPFHVALIPTEVHDTSVLTATPSEPHYATPEEGTVTDDMRLDLSTAAVSRALSAELAEAFVRATLLELPEDPATLAGLSAAERDQFWQKRARATGADLLVRTRLLIDPAIDGERNEKFWLNLPLFLLGGPMCYFVGDRSYLVSARLQAEVFDVSEGHANLDDFALLAIPLYVESSEQDLRFLDRADGAGDYALSLLIPAGLLARESSEIESELEDRLPRRLGRELAARVFRERAQFEQNLALGAFQLESEGAELLPAGAGRLHLRVPVRELTASGALRRYEVRHGETLLASGDFTTTGPEPRRMIEGEFELPTGAEYLNVRL
ncbi:MAG TPA: hypothetical protein VF530_22755, partial [Planctomycetota bacterium]